MKCIFHFILNSSSMIHYKILKCEINIHMYHNLMTHQGWNAFEISLSSDLLWMQWDELRAQWEKSPIQCHGESQDKKFCIYYALSMYMLIHKMLFIYIYMFSIFLCFTSKELITKKLIMVYIIIHQTYCTYTNLGNN